MLVFSTFLYYLQGIQSIIFYNFKDENDKSKFMKKLILCTLLFLAYSCDTEDSASEENTSVFLTKNNNTIWSDPDLYYGEYPDIKFSNAEIDNLALTPLFESTYTLSLASKLICSIISLANSGT